MLTEANRLTQGIKKDFAIRTIPEMRTDFLTDFTGQFIVQVGGETLQHFDTIPFPVTLVRGGLAGAWICAYAICHGGASS